MATNPAYIRLVSSPLHCPGISHAYNRYAGMLFAHTEDRKAMLPNQQEPMTLALAIIGSTLQSKDNKVK